MKHRSIFNPMKKASCFWLFVIVFGLQSQAQLPERFRSGWHRGMELYELELFANAQQRLLLEAPDDNALTQEWNSYKACLSGLELMNSDAEYLVHEFSSNYPESAYKVPLTAQTADHFFTLRRYRQASEWFETLPLSRMKKEEQAEYRFKKGYSNFMLDNDSTALVDFQQVATKESEYRSAATYYSAFILYTDSQYEASLRSFESLKEDEQFGAVTPYYLTQIYYKTERYDDLIETAEELLKQDEVVRRDEIERLLADAYYRRDDFQQAAIHFERYKEAGGKFRSEDRFQMGYSYYRIERFPEAIDAFNKITDSKGPLAQDAWYFLGDCYLSTGKKSRALTAFEAASKLENSVSIQKEARYLFVKLNYELDGPYLEVGRAIQDYIDDYPQATERVQELNALLANYFIHQRNYPKALEALRKAGSKNAELNAAHQKVAYYQGIQLLNAGQFAKSRDLFAESRLYAVNPQFFALSHYWTAEALYRQEKYNEAIEALNIFRESPGAVNTSEFLLAEYDLAYSHYRLKDWEQAAVFFRGFSGRYTEEDALRSDARIRAADAYFMLARYDVATDYYDLAAKNNSREGDYALLQKANCQGLLGKDIKKIATLLDLQKRFPDSRYAAEASFERANTLLKLDRNTESLAAFASFRKNFPKHPLVRTALLNEGLVLRNLNQLDSSVARLRSVVERYPATEEANEAISFARLVYADMGQIDAYIDWVQRIDFADVKTAKLDSTLYNSAFEAYALEDCSTANLRFAQYLERFPSGLFMRKVHYYHARCLEAEENKVSARKQWEALFQLGQGEHRDVAAFKMGAYSYADSAYDKARDYFLQLNEGDDPQLLRESRFFLLRIAVEQELDESIIELANHVLDDIKTSPERITYALLQRARSRYALGRYETARSDYQQLYDNPKGISAAEAGYHIARMLHMDGLYQESVDLVYQSMERTPGFPQWREESLFLLVENFIALKDHFQAEYTLDFIEKNPVGNESLQRAADLRQILAETPEKEEEQELKMEAFKSLRIEELPAVELPEEEGEEMNLGLKNFPDIQEVEMEEEEEALIEEASEDEQLNNDVESDKGEDNE